MAEPFDTLIVGGTLVGGDASRSADIAIQAGQIASVDAPGSLDPGPARVIDATGLHVLPGLIDGHVHFRQPGLEHKEDWQSGSRAAVLGGVTTVLEMPNTVPPTASAQLAAAKARLAGAASYCDFGLLGLLGDNAVQLDGLLAERSVVGLKVFLGPTTGGLRASSRAGLLEGLRRAAQAGVHVAFHAEDPELIAAAELGVRAAARTDPLAHLDARPVQAEVRAIEYAGELLAKSAAKGHILHLSSAEGLAAVQRWRSGGLDLSCEVSAHHCFLSALDYGRLGGLIKCNPPVREPGQGAALLAALAEGVIDAIASDHAPHAPPEKQAADIWQVEAGIAGVETSPRLFLTAVADGRLGLDRLVRAYAERPAQLWGLWPRKGALLVGSDADIAFVDMAGQGVIRAAELHAKHALTPFDGWPTRGAVIGTMVRGRLVTWQGQLLVEPGWGRAVERGGASRPA